MDNIAYAEILEEIATLRQIRGDNPFKSRAFETAARHIRKMPELVDELLDDGYDLTQIDGIGKSIARELQNIYESGASITHTELANEFPPGILDIMRVEGLGPKRVKLLYEELGISDLEMLEEAVNAGKISELPGLGTKTEEKIKSELERLKTANPDRIPLPAAKAAAESIASSLRALDCTSQVEVAGSIRRGRETIGDIDILVSAEDHETVFDTFMELREVGEVIVRGPTKTSARLRSGTQVDVRVVEEHEFGAALHYFTGSKDHNIQIRARAKKRGLRINEYGVLRLEDEVYIAGATEEEIFESVDLPWIPPELRQGADEIELAEKGELPDLVDMESLRGDIHMHTTESDGRNSIEEMVEAAQELGYEYIIITDHSSNVAVANGMDEKRFEAHIKRMREASKKYKNFDVLAGIEVDILSDGTLDMDHDLLAECDWVVGSVHTQMNQKPENMTARLLKAINTGLLSCLGHPTGRILGGRKGYDYDFNAVVEAAVEHGTAFEMNGSSGRLDLNADLAGRVVRKGGMIVLGSDAHSIRGLGEMRFAVQQARRAGLEKEDVLNTLSAKGILGSVRPAI